MAVLISFHNRPKAFNCNLYYSIFPILKHLIRLLNILQTIPVSNQRRGVNQSLLYKRENLGTGAAVNTAGLEGEILDAQKPVASVEYIGEVITSPRQSNLA